MRDHQDAETFLAQPVEQVQDSRADGDVEHRDGLVGDEQVRPEDDARRDRDALALTARELVRVALEEELGRRKLDACQRIANALAPLLPRAAEAVDLERLLDGGLHREARVERLVGVLVDQLHAPAQRPQSPALQPRDVVAVELDPPRDRLDQPQHGLSGGRLAAAGLADQRDQLAARDGEADALDRTDDLLWTACDRTDEPARDRVVDDEVLDRDQRAGAVRAAHAVLATTSFRWQAAERLPPSSFSAGCSSLQRVNARSQRGWKGQP